MAAGGWQVFSIWYSASTVSMSPLAMIATIITRVLEESDHVLEMSTYDPTRYIFKIVVDHDLATGSQLRVRPTRHASLVCLRTQACVGMSSAQKTSAGSPCIGTAETRHVAIHRLHIEDARNLLLPRK